MDSPVIRPGSQHTHTAHYRRKISPIYKWLGLTRHGRVRRKKIRALRIGACVGLIVGMAFGLYLWAANSGGYSSTSHVPPWRAGKPTRPGAR